MSAVSRFWAHHWTVSHSLGTAVLYIVRRNILIVSEGYSILYCLRNLSTEYRPEKELRFSKNSFAINLRIMDLSEKRTEKGKKKLSRWWRPWNESFGKDMKTFNRIFLEFRRIVTTVNNWDIWMTHRMRNIYFCEANEVDS